MAQVETKSINMNDGRWRRRNKGTEVVMTPCCLTCFRPARYVYSFSGGRGGEIRQQIFCQACADFAAPAEAV